jgi:hypothetical protein
LDYRRTIRNSYLSQSDKDKVQEKYTDHDLVDTESVVERLLIKMTQMRLCS